MNDEYYREKYLKYKNKYASLKEQIEIRGGTIGEIPIERLAEEKKSISVPEQTKNYIKMITVPNTEVIRVGSSYAKIQPFFSDIDVMNIIEKSDMDKKDVIKFFIKQLKVIIENLVGRKDRFFSDFKAGGVHWSPEEIIAEKKDGLTLEEACKMKDVVKIDMIAPYEERYVEMSTFFVLKSKEGYINVNENYFSQFSESLKKDIQEYKESKPFKAIKRVWSLARIDDDLDVLDQLKDLIRSNIALMSQVNADVETIMLLIEHGSDYNIQFVINELNKFKERLSNILDINYDEEKTDYMIDNIILLLTYTKNTKEEQKELLEKLENLHDHILEIINKETLDYLKYIGYKFPGDKSEGILTSTIKYLFGE